MARKVCETKNGKIVSHKKDGGCPKNSHEVTKRTKRRKY